MIPAALYNEFLAYMKKNGALFFEMYYDRTDTVYTDMLDGRAFPEKTETARGISLRAFDGENHLCLSTEDLSEDNLRGMVHKMAGRMSPANHKQPLRCDTPGNLGSRTAGREDEWTPRRATILEALPAAQVTLREKLGAGFQVKTRCYFQKQEVHLLNSFNGETRDERNLCCVLTEAGEPGTRASNVLTPVSYEELSHTLQANGLINIRPAESEEPKDCPSGCFDLVLLSGSASLFFHACCGHPLEIAHAKQPGAVFNGMLGKKVARECVTLYDSGSIPGLWGSIPADDEGNPARENVLIRNGILTGYLSDIAEAYRYGLEPSGTTRRQNYKKTPAARMTNTYIAAGTQQEDDIIKDTKNGLLITSFSFGNVNPVTGDFTVKISSGNFIRNGVIEEPFRGGQVRAGALDVLSRIDRVAGNLTFKNGFCQASSGRIPVSGGQPTLRITGVPVYGK